MILGLWDMTGWMVFHCHVLVPCELYQFHPVCMMMLLESQSSLLSTMRTFIRNPSISMSQQLLSLMQECLTSGRPRPFPRLFSLLPAAQNGVRNLFQGFWLLLSNACFLTLDFIRIWYLIWCSFGWIYTDLIESLPYSVRLLPLMNIILIVLIAVSAPYQILITHDLIVSYCIYISIYIYIHIRIKTITVLKPQFLIISTHRTTST